MSGKPTGFLSEQPCRERKERTLSQVLLINTPMWSPGEHTTFDRLAPPLGLAYLAASLEQEGISVRILDLSVSLDPGSELQSVLNMEPPLLVGISTLTQNAFLAIKVAKIVKAVAHRAFVVVGGPHFSYLAAEALSEPAIDAVALFEGDRTIVELYSELQNTTKDLSRVAGLMLRDGDRPVATEPRSHEKDLDSLPFPARHLLPMSVYSRPGTIMTSRGCPQKCIFCISSTYEGSYRCRNAESVVQELAILRKTWGIREVYFIDNVFTVNKERVRKICEQMVNLNLDMRFHCVSRADLIEEDTVGWLRSAGCERIEIGVESGSQEIIEAFDKNITLEQVRRAAEIVLTAGLRPMFTFQIGSPFETPESLAQTRQLAAELRSKGGMTFFSIMTPYPGTILARKAQELGIRIHATKWQEYRTSNPVYDTTYMGRNDFRGALYAEIIAQMSPETAFGAGRSFQ